MTTDMFVNLPTSDLERSKAFFEGIGWSINPLFTDENAACIVIEDHQYLMMLKPEFFATFTEKPIADPHTSLQVSLALSRDSREAVDAFMEKVLAAGGAEPREAQDYGFMYSRDFDDPDGNSFGVLWMDPVAAEQGPEAYAEQNQGS